MNPSDVDKLRLGIYGDIKTGKTSLALSFSKPIFHVDLDIGGFQRAEARVLKLGYSVMKLPGITAVNQSLPQFYQTQGWKQLPDIITKPYPLPLKFPGQAIHGMMAVWEELIDDLLFMYATPQISTIVIDTGTMMHQISTMAHLERIQAKNPERQVLQQIEYARPNTEERSLLSGAYTYEKNLVITHHAGGKYESRLTAKGTEEIRVGDTWAGFNGMGAIVDLVARSFIAPSPNGTIVPRLWIEDCGLTLQAKGEQMENPTFDSLLELINNFRLTEAQ